MTGDIFIYGGIGTDERNQEVSFENVRQQLARNKAATELTVHIISPGGDVPEGEAIYNALRNSGKKITTMIEGTCASIATLIAGAGDRILMNKTARFMIHNPQVTAIQGPADARVLRNVAAQLDQIKTLLINVYKKRTGLPTEELWALYDNETWMSAEEAAEKGFIDEAVDAIKAVAKVDLTKIKNQMDKEGTVFQNLIKRFSNMLASTKIKNEASVTLQDGTVIVVLTEDGDFTGKQVMYESGEPLPAGSHPLTDGRTIEVDANSTITAVKEAEVDNSQVEEDMKKDEEIANLKAQLAEAQAKANEAVAQVTTANANVTKFQNKVQTLEQDFIKLKEEALKTVGDKSSPAKGASFVNMDNPAQYHDPMGEEVKTFLQSRNRI